MKSQENKKASNNSGKRWVTILALPIIFGLVIFIYIHFFFIWGEGVKTGQLNYVVYKGFIFKTYEGKLIQSGLRSDNAGRAVRSNEFVFSVANKTVANKLMLSGGREVGLHYMEYLGAVPWRGYSKYVVDRIIEIK